MVIVDTTVWIDYLGGTTTPHTSWLNRELTRQRLGLTDLILCEVLQGIRDDAVFTQVHHDLLRFQVFSTGGVDLAVASAQNYRALRKRGITVRKTMIALSQLSVWMQGTLCFTAIRITIHLRHISVYRSFIHERPIYRQGPEAIAHWSFAGELSREHHHAEMKALAVKMARPDR